MEKENKKLQSIKKLLLQHDIFNTISMDGIVTLLPKVITKIIDVFEEPYGLCLMVSRANGEESICCYYSMYKKAIIDTMPRIDAKTMKEAAFQMLVYIVNKRPELIINNHGKSNKIIFQRKRCKANNNQAHKSFRL